MTDQVFGELRYEDDYGWWGKQALEFGGNLHTVDILIHDDGEKVISHENNYNEEYYLR